MFKCGCKNSAPKHSVNYIEQGQEIVFDNNEKIENILKRPKDKVAELMSTKNVNFLLGAGTSLPAIKTMEDLQTCFEKHLESCNKYKQLYEKVKARNLNLEDILGKLYAAQHAKELLSGEYYKKVDLLINKIKSFIFTEINISNNAAGYSKTSKLYEDFYNRISFRNKDLARVNIFTTNYDLFNERALDSLNIDYNNGFGGGINKYFNPARFHYTYSRKMDASIEKFEPIESMVYLYKLHGSISWVRSTNINSPFNTEEKLSPEYLDEDSSKNRVLIYPSPLKSGDSLSTPYSDLIREFKAKLLLQHSVLFVIGYSFRDDHINNIIYQAMAVNTSLSIFCFGEIACTQNHKFIKIMKQDQRFYQLNSTTISPGAEKTNEEPMIHYFQYVIKNILPTTNIDQDKDMLKTINLALSKLADSNN